MRQKFSEVTALSEREPGRFDANADPGWTIAGKPNGGYLLAMIGQAASRVSAHPHILAASGHYLRPPDPGPVTVRADVLRAGRSASQVRASLAAGGRTCVEALLTLGRHEQEESPYWQGLPPVSLPPFEDCVPLAGLPGRFRPAILDQVDIRLDRETAGYATGTPSGRGELRGWLSLPDGEPFDGPALLYAADAFPPATLDIAMSRWVPTFELTVYVRAIPAPGPVRIVHRAQLIQGQLVDETCHIWDSKDRLVAQSTQLAGIRLGLWGAGEGTDAIRLAKLGYQVDAVEVSAVACEKIERLAKSEGVKITIRNEPVETAQLRAGCYDVVLMNGCLHYVREKTDVLRRVQAASTGDAVHAVSLFSTATPVPPEHAAVPVFPDHEGGLVEQFYPDWRSLYQAYERGRSEHSHPGFGPHVHSHIKLVRARASIRDENR